MPIYFTDCGDVRQAPRKEVKATNNPFRPEMTTMTMDREFCNMNIAPEPW